MLVQGARSQVSFERPHLATVPRTTRLGRFPAEVIEGRPPYPKVSVAPLSCSATPQSDCTMEQSPHLFEEDMSEALAGHILPNVSSGLQFCDRARLRNALGHAISNYSAIS